MSVEFRYARHDEYPQVSVFLNDYWAKNHIYCRDEKLYHWSFGRGGRHWAESAAGGSSMALAEDKGEMVGILGGIPFTFNALGESKRGVWITNFVIRPDYRKGPTALQLLSMFRGKSKLEGHDYDATVAFGINPATATIYKVLRGEVLGDIPRQMLVLPGAADRMAQLLKIVQPDWPGERTKNLAASLELETMPAIGGNGAGNAVPDNWDNENWAIIARQTVGAARDADFLKWRYRDHPLFTYRVVTIPDGTRTGLAVWRLETIHRDTESGREPVDKIARLVEFLPVSEDNGRSLFSAFLAQAGEAGAFAADYYGYHGEYGRQLELFGMKRVSTLEDGGLIPTRFQPLDGKGGGIMSAMFVQFPVPACAPGPECQWYWTKADSDQDRPN